MAHGITEYLAWLAAQLCSDQAIKAFCASNGWTSPKAWIGQDSKESLPGAEDCPYFVFTWGGRQLSADGHLSGFAVRLGICCHDDRKATAAGAVTSWPGAALADEFSDVVRHALVDIASGHTSGYYVASIPGGGPDDSIDFPFFRSWLGLSVQADSDILP